MKEEWLFPNAIVPVDVETTAALVAEIHRLIGVVGGMALAQPEQEPVCDKDPQGCWNVRCQLGKKCKNTPPAQKRPQNCGTGYCSCIECVMEPRNQEPVAYQYQSKDGVWRDFISQSHYEATVEDGSWPIRALYTSPQPAQRTWVGLTTKEIREWWASENGLEDCLMAKLDDFEQVARAIETKLKEKNT